MEKDAIRVVIAVDEPISRMDLKELLTEGGYTVVAEVSDGFDAVENCKLYHPDLVLLDIKMPFLDGLAAAKIIYEEELADTIIMLTAYSEREFVEQAKDYGVSGYLVKPIDEKSLIPNIELVVAQSKEMKRLRKDMAKVSERLANRSIIEKGTGDAGAEPVGAGGVPLYTQAQSAQGPFHAPGGRDDPRERRGLTGECDLVPLQKVYRSVR